MGTFDGKVALVTGGTAGMGLVTAVAFAKQRAKVVVCGRREAEGVEALRLIKQAGGEGLFIRCDVTKASDVETMIDRIEATYGRLDIAFNNAGVGAKYLPIEQQTEEEFDRVTAINLKGVWLCMKHEIPAILRAGGGAIVNNSSVGGLIGLAGMGIYNATKHGVLGLTKSAAIDYAKKGIRINAVCPGIIQTEMAASSMGGREAVQKLGAARHPIGRAGESEEVADAVLWLCSPQSSMLIGQAIALDGGRTITG
jgi:NAD(P)-dependent dehydrogenase (short-subunit alcohol dehydrogenase family)